MSRFISLNENLSNNQPKVHFKILVETVLDFMVFLLGKN